MSITSFAKRVGLLPPDSTKEPLISPEVKDAMTSVSDATASLRKELLGQDAIDAMLKDMLGDHYVPPMGRI